MKRTKRWKWLAIGIFFCCGLLAQAAQPIWKITGNGLPYPSYLFGAGALQPVTVYHNSPEFGHAFAETEALIVESNSSPSEFVSKIRTYGLMKDHKLRQLLSEDTYKKVDKEVQGAITIGLFFLPGSIKPAALSMIICSAWAKGLMEHPNEELLNKWLMNQCKKRKIPVISLESPEEQMDLMMNNGSNEQQAELLKQLILNKEQMIETYRQSHRYYELGDYEKVAQLGLNHPLPYAKDKEGLEKMITERNRVWVEKIATQMRSKRCLILLNPAQLVFEGGMIRLLQEAGYTVTKE